MKKVLSFIMLLLVLGTCAFASHRVTVTFDPFTFQSFVQKNGETKDKVNSKYGIGGGIGYNWEFGKGFILGADIKADTYMLEGQENYTDVSFLAKAGYSCKMSESFSLYSNMKLGLDIQSHDEKTSTVLEFGPEVGVSFKLNEHLDLFASCEGLFGFPRKGEVKYSEFRVTPTIGMGYTL